MLDIKLIEKEPEVVKKNLSKRGFDISIIDKILSISQARKELITKVETIRAELNSCSKEIGKLKKAGSDASEMMNKVTELKKSNEKNNDELDFTKSLQDDLISTLPNLVADEVPSGKSEEQNIEIGRWGTPRRFNFQVSDHHDLGEKLGMLDFDAAAKITGARFVVYKNDLARLERALANFMLDFHAKNGYEEIIPPFIVHERSMFGTGQLPKFAEDSFKLEGFPWYLIPTSEVPLTNIMRENIWNESDFPKKFCAFTPCFRSEAGSYGKDTKGLIRMHQFNKVEMVNITLPEDSVKTHEAMVSSAKGILEALELPYRELLLCAGDSSASGYKTIDLEVWLPSQDTYREISSVSNCTDYQARRAGIRFKRPTGKPEYAHTLNGSGLAVGRTLVAILENYQLEDGSVALPKVIQPYMGGQELIKAQ